MHLWFYSCLRMNLMMFLLVCAKTLIDRNWSMWSRENYVSQPFPPGEKKELIWSYYLPQRVVVRIMRLYINLPYPESLLYASIVLNSSDILCLTHSQSDISCVVCCPSCSRQNQICKSKILLIFKKIIFKKLIFCCWHYYRWPYFPPFFCPPSPSPCPWLWP